jgi:hypothetical protein
VHAFRRSARRGRLTPQAMVKIRAALDEAIAKIEAVAGDRDRDR